MSHFPTASALETPLPDAIERAIAGGNFETIGVLRFGSWAIHVHSTRGSFIENLAFLYKQNAREIREIDPASLSIGEMPSLYFIHAGFCPVLEEFMANEVSVQGPMPEDSYLSRQYSTDGEPSQKISLLLTEAIKTLVVQGPGSPRIYMVVDDDEMKDLYRFRVHLAFVMNRILFDFHRIYVHAGAVRFKNQTSLFVGDRGQGKSTTCLRLGAAGATVLSDDHIMLYHHNGNFLVSGCESYARITRKTEAFLMEKPLEKTPRDFAGVLKKEFPVSEHFDAHPYHDYPVDNVFFLRRGRQFSIEPISRQQAVVELINKTKTALRFNRAQEFGSYLDFFSSFVKNAQVYDLGLTTTLQDLDHLTSFLSQ
jgi:hypothetical protein